jgi:DNA invertase Pin-like site-specific DNA recombinase
LMKKVKEVARGAGPGSMTVSTRWNRGVIEWKSNIAKRRQNPNNHSRLARCDTEPMSL